ncbi:response regulator [Microcoleus sp. FACHB-831]|jgi:two-component system cell cycle response regulator DivK|uniref:response regulator n=1 Tax=Microcoleus sp. FACHB-831 TaxID=2692827 RepID=UPI001689EF01|nr:response regulator [Microcoleus sp. FACHB-831]MBD1923116.1 response regulator [Microcoleus sp. FACHB-831]
MSDSSASRTVSALRILLVEDNDTNREMLSDYLSYFGYEVFKLADGYKFFQTQAQFQPHLVLLDLKLPEIDGYTLLEQIKQRSDWPQVPVIVVSAFAFEADKQRAISLGARRYFVKPVNLNALSQAIQEELANLTR